MKKNSLVIITGLVFFITTAGFVYAAYQPYPAQPEEGCGQGIGAVSCDDFFSGSTWCASNPSQCTSYNCADYGGISGVGCSDYISYFFQTCNSVCDDTTTPGLRCCWRASADDPWDCSDGIYYDSSKEGRTCQLPECYGDTQYDADLMCQAKYLDEHECVDSNTVGRYGYHCEIYGGVGTEGVCVRALESAVACSINPGAACLSPTNKSCECEGYVCKIVTKALDEVCVETEPGVAGCSSVMLTCDEVYCPEGSSSTACKDNAVYETTTWYKCNDASQYPLQNNCYPMTTENLVEDCGGCSPTGNKKCGTFTPSYCQDQLFQQHCVAFPDDPLCAPCRNPASGIQGEYICTICSSGDCVPGPIEWKNEISCGTPSDVEFSWCAKSQPALPGISCTLTASFSAQCVMQPGPICEAPTVDIVCDGVCNEDPVPSWPPPYWLPAPAPPPDWPPELPWPPSDWPPAPPGWPPELPWPPPEWPPSDWPPAPPGWPPVPWPPPNWPPSEWPPAEWPPAPPDWPPELPWPPPEWPPDPPAPPGWPPGLPWPPPNWPPYEISPGYHTECFGEECLYVEGVGVSDCNQSSDCLNSSHSKCDIGKQCVSINEPGISTCFGDSDCQGNIYFHNTCAFLGKCVVVTGPGADTCNNDDDCYGTEHKECNTNLVCETKDGPGLDLCSDILFCTGRFHTDCNLDKKCVAALGTGLAYCNDDEFCGANTHNECIENKCVVVGSPGIDECSQPCDCNPLIGSHTVCTMQKTCQSVLGAGLNICDSNSWCAMNTHNICAGADGNTCTVAEGLGTDACFEPNPDSYCTNDANNQRNVCTMDDKCEISYESGGFDECPVAGQANVTECIESYHNECFEDTCVVVENLIPGEPQADECTNHEYCESQNNPPVADLLQISETGACTGIPGAGLLYFSWRFTDADLNDKETRFIFQIDDDLEFSSPRIVDKLVNVNYYPSPSTNQRPIYVVLFGRTINGDYINYNTNYYWRVMVTDDSGADNADSEWAYGEIFNYEGQPAPSPSYILNPSSLPAELPETVQFEDNSLCYNGDNPLGSSCKDLGASYKWWFGDPYIYRDTVIGHYDNTVPEFNEGPVHSYSEKKTYPTSLEVCDDLGQCCPASVPISGKGGGGLPNWKEISPF